MRERYIYHKGDDAFAIASMKKYFDQKQEMDKFLEKLIAPFIAGKNLKILDAGCGIGHEIFLLNKLSPQSTFLGVDQTAVFIEEAKMLQRDSANVSFEINDMEDLPAKYPKAFNVAVSRGVISWLPYYESFVKALMDVTKDHIFISSLFYDGDIDFITQAREFKKESGRSGFSEYRNVYSLPHFKEFVIGLGAKNVQADDFDIGVDLPRGSADVLGTYTEKLSDGRRLQISGAVVMSWKWIRIDL